MERRERCDDHRVSNKNKLLQQLFDIFWKLRGVLREQNAATPTASNSAERSLGVKRANLPNPEDYEDMLEAMSVCDALELDLNQPHEDGCDLYIKYWYNQAVVDNFIGDEFVGAERKQPLKERMATPVKEVHKLTAQTLKAGNAGRLVAKKNKRGRGSGWKHPAKQGISISPRTLRSQNRLPEGSWVATCRRSNASSARNSGTSPLNVRISEGLLLFGSRAPNGQKVPGLGRSL